MQMIVKYENVWVRSSAPLRPLRAPTRALPRRHMLARASAKGWPGASGNAPGERAALQKRAREAQRSGRIGARQDLCGSYFTGGSAGSARIAGLCPPDGGFFWEA